MSTDLHAEIWDWMQDRPAWQREAYLRLREGEPIPDEFIHKVAVRLASGEDWPPPQNLPARNASAVSLSEPAVINDVKIINNVNALLPSQVLTFAPVGLTIVYGDNRSGKSGYARLLKNATAARVREKVLGNVYTENHDSSPEATICVTVAGKNFDFGWNNPPLAVSRGHYYDSQCGEDYLTHRSPVEYRPLDLRELEMLVDVCQQVGDELKALEAKAEHNLLRIPNLKPEGIAQKFLNALSANTPTEKINERCRLLEEEEAAIERLQIRVAQIESEEPIQQKKKHTDRVIACNFLDRHFEYLGERLGRSQLIALAERQAKIIERKEAARLALADTIGDSPLNGVASKAWLRLWEAAQEYSEQHAYPRLHFPNASHGARCVLCQQYLDDAAQARMTSFAEAVSQYLIHEATEEQAKLDIVFAEIEQTEIEPRLVAEAISQIQEINPIVIGEIRNHLDRFQRIRQATLESSLAAGAEVATQETLSDVRQSLQDIARSESFAAEAINESGSNSVAENLRNGIAELEDRRLLRDYQDQIINEQERLLRVQNIRTGIAAANTQGLTRKIAQVVRRHVTDEMATCFSRFAENFKVPKIELIETGGERGKLMTALGLAGAPDQYKVQDILSESEARISSLARFFTDVHFEASQSPLVLDDPVSSLDNINRKRVAEHLCELAIKRQVIVFTHDQAFVIALRRKAAQMELPTEERSIVRTLSTDQPGEVLNYHEFSNKTIKERLTQLENDLSQLRIDYKANQRKTYLNGLAAWAGKFSVLLEEMIKIDLVGPVVDQDSMEVHPKMLRLFARFSNKEYQEFQWLYSEATEKLERHAKAPQAYSGSVGPDEINDILQRARKWSKKIGQLASQT